MTSVPEMKLNATDAAEPTEMLQFPSQWLAPDPGRLAPSLQSSLTMAGTGGIAYHRRPTQRLRYQRAILVVTAAGL